MKVNLNIDPDLRLGDPGKIILSLFHEQTGHVLAEKEFKLHDLIMDYISANTLIAPGSSDSIMYIPISARSNVSEVIEKISDISSVARTTYSELTEHNVKNLSSVHVL